jgi:hypothetical protein
LAGPYPIAVGSANLVKPLDGRVHENERISVDVGVSRDVRRFLV